MVGFFPRTLIDVYAASAQRCYRHGSTYAEVALRDLQTLPRRRLVKRGTAAVLLILAAVPVAAPDAVPGLVVPSAAHNARVMQATSIGC